MSQEKPVPQEQPTPDSQDKPQEKKHSQKSVIGYLFILFAAAFLLLLLAYFMQQRNSEEIIGDLRESMTDMQAVNDMLAENSQLRSELQIAQEALEESGQAMTDLEEEKAQLSDALAQAQADSQALTILAQAESLAAQDDQEGTAALLAPYAGENPTLLSDGSTLEEALTRVEAGLQEDQSDYSPLARYEALVGGEQP